MDDQTVPVDVDTSILRLDRRIDMFHRVSNGLNVSEACKELGTGRATYYRWRKRYLQQGLPGLFERSRAPRIHPKTAPDAAIARLLILVEEHPRWGATRLSRALRAEGHSMCPATVQKHLIRRSLGTQSERLNARGIRHGQAVNRHPNSTRRRCFDDSTPYARKTLRIAHHYYLFGLPGQMTQDFLLETPSLQDLSRYMGIGAWRLEQVATREGWAYVRQKVRNLFGQDQGIFLGLLEKRRQLYVVLTEVRAFQRQALQQLSTPAPTLPALHALIRRSLMIQRRFKEAIASEKPVVKEEDNWTLFDWVMLEGGSPAIDTSPFRSVTVDSIREALSGYLQGIWDPDVPDRFHPRPSIKILAKRIPLPVRALRVVAQEQFWTLLREYRDCSRTAAASTAGGDEEVFTFRDLKNGFINIGGSVNRWILANRNRTGWSARELKRLNAIFSMGSKLVMQT